jgi:hypothetical protein
MNSAEAIRRAGQLFEFFSRVGGAAYTVPGPASAADRSTPAMENLSKQPNIVAVTYERRRSFRPDPNSFSGSSVLRSPERAEVALSAVICTYSRCDLLPGAVESLARQGAPTGSFEIIVVDNSPDRAGAARFGKRYAGLSNLTYLVKPRAGLSNARNEGAAALVRPNLRLH